jgi:hypothetical protein
MKYDIPINISIAAPNEQRAVNEVFDFLRKAYNEFGPEHCVTNWEYFEFITEESGNTGCGDYNPAQGGCACPTDKVSDDSGKGK